MTASDIAKYHVELQFFVGWLLISAGMYLLHWISVKKFPPAVDWIIVAFVYTLIQIW